jgi:hypothetical protein
MKTTIFSIIIAALVLGALGCSEPRVQETPLQQFALNSTDGIISRSNVQLDRDISHDGQGSLRIDATAPIQIRLLELNNIDVEKAVLIYRAKLRSENLDGLAYLEMWCRFPGKGEYFSRNMATPVRGTTEWTSEETPFYCLKGQRPDLVKLNLVVEGTGTVWIDDIDLVKGELP